MTYSKAIYLIGMILLFLLTFSLAGLRAEENEPWWDSQARYRVTLEVVNRAPSVKINTALLNLNFSLPVEQEYSGLRLTDSSGKLVPMRILPGKELELIFPVENKKSSRYHLYLGCSSSAAAHVEWEVTKGGLWLETKKSPGNHPRNWSDMAKLLRKSTRRFGRAKRKIIHDRSNPFGPQDNYLSIYEGYIYCPESGKYGFATDSDDASFLFIDEELVAQWPRGHSAAAKWCKVGVIYLEEGVHRIDYYHEQGRGTQLASAGWKRPGDTLYDLIPEEAFVEYLPTSLIAVEETGKELNAFFSYIQRGCLQVNDLDTLLISVSFQNLSRIRGGGHIYHWDFGDDQESKEENPTHTFIGTGKYTVSLTVTDDRGKKDTLSREVVLRERVPEEAILALTIGKMPNVIAQDEPVVIPVKVRNDSPSRRMEVTLKRETFISPARVEERELELLLPAQSEHNVEYKFDSPQLTHVAFTLLWSGKIIQKEEAVIADSRSKLPELKIVGGTLRDEAGRRVVIRRVKQDRKVNVEEQPQEEGLGIVLFGDPLVNVISSVEPHYEIWWKGFLQEDHDSLELVSGAASSLPPSFSILEAMVEVNRVISLKPDVVLLSPGWRDLYSHVPLEKYGLNLEAIIDQLEAHTQARVFLLTPPPLTSKQVGAVNYLVKMKEIGLERHLEVIDLYSFFLSRGEGWKSLYKDEDRLDPIYFLYPHSQGQRLIAETILAKIRGIERR